MPYKANDEEKDILEFWNEYKIFEQSVLERPENKPYVFYDGPPFATGLPHYGHLMAGTKKDVIPRYFTMQGYRVERRWGWDCHGLPIENLIEKELGISGPKEILEYGVDRFNEACRAKVLEYADEWKNVVPRMGRWVDMDNPYKTMDLSFMESVWWVFSELSKKGLIYEGHKAMHVCPHCATPLSNFEVAQGYKDVKDIAVTVKFTLQETSAKKELFGNTPAFVLAWTTTPWSLPGDVLLAVGNDIEYAVVEYEGALYILAKERLEAVIKDRKYELKKIVRGVELVGLAYDPLFPYYADIPHAFRVVSGDFVSTTDGTGIVHIAPAFGEDDYAVGKREGVPLVQHVTIEGRMKSEVTDFAGMEVKPKGEDKIRLGTDIAVLKYLQDHGSFFTKENITHSYPHCWRCDTPLLNYATSSWFVRVTSIQQALIENNEKITWIPEHIKYGRFGKWLEGVKDWSISRNRFWGTPIPVWKCQTPNAKCQMLVVGSASELEKLSGQKVADLHKHVIDELVLKCPDCGGEMRRVPEVLDTWFDSGSVPYGQFHYPFENKKKFEDGFPADFIAESQDQTRGWFYTLHVLATALTHQPVPSIPQKESTSAFKTVSVNGIILAEDGQKMSKRLKNYPDPMAVVDKYGADALRFYLLSSPVMHGESLNFSELGVWETYNKIVNTLWNVVEFYRMFASERSVSEVERLGTKHILDKWILAKLQILVKDVTEHLNAYRLSEATRPIEEFITELSQWYVRRSRDRFKGGDENDKTAAIATLHHILLTLSKVMAPFTPFVSEKIFMKMKNSIDGEVSARMSVHLERWPEVEENFLDANVIEEMAKTRKIVEMGLALRAEAGIKVRQVLKELRIMNHELRSELRQLIIDELNVKTVSGGEVGEAHWKIREDGGIRIALDTEVTEELKREGLSREIIRTINQMRKEAGLTVRDTIAIVYTTDDPLLHGVIEQTSREIRRHVMADSLDAGDVSTGDTKEIDGRTITFSIRKV